MHLVINNLSLKVIIVGLVFIISPILTFGHNPLSARYYLEVGEKVSMLTINLSQDGVNQVLLKTHSREALEKMPKKEFDELIVDYIKSHFNLSIDDEKVLLKEGGIKTGSHQTDLRFVLPPFPKNTENIEVHIPAFNENENHQTIFSYNFQGNKNRVILSSKNDYQSKIVLSEASQKKSWIWYRVFGAISSIALIATFFFVRWAMAN